MGLQGRKYTWIIFKLNAFEYINVLQPDMVDNDEAYVLKKDGREVLLYLMVF